ncbi:SPOR domain-containing protein [Stenotrophomonas pennii]|uniref:SPOR domain-containing protein n=1 Tax=Stenotrophomonas lacuserhaii TaxID=2760084 RepID=UPI00320A3439
MLTRALIVFLVLLNVSVALWWMLRGGPVVPDVQPPSGVAELQLVDAAAPATAPSPTASTAPLTDTTPIAAEPAAAVAASPSTEAPATAPVAAAPAPPAPAAEPAPTPAAPERCVALGPFADQAAAQGALAKAGAALTRTRLREQSTPGATSRYRVMMPPAETREAAQVTVQRIVAAGLSDYYVIGQGPDANAIALGQYRNREGAERRLAALRAAGFQAQLSGGEGASTWWLQGALADGKADPGLRQRSGAAQQRSLDCAGLR